MSSTLSLALPAAVEADCRRRIGAGSKSFALASRLLPRPSRRGALVVYAWCRRADDAIDRAPAARQAAALAGLEAELEALFMQAGTGDATIDAFGTVARATAMPPHYPRELLAGMRMDLERRRYADTRALLHYCYRVAGTVGLMMTHVMGLREPGALHAAAHLGIAMQLTNICRDVVEDWRMGRLYLPDELLAPELLAHLPALLGGPLPAAVRAPLRRVVARVLDLAALFYAAAEVGFPALPWRSALSIRAARGIYAAIGDRIRATGCDVLAGRAVVPLAGKLLAVARAGAAAAAELPARARAARDPATARYRSPDRVLAFADLALPVP